MGQQAGALELRGTEERLPSTVPPAARTADPYHSTHCAPSALGQATDLLAGVWRLGRALGGGLHSGRGGETCKVSAPRPVLLPASSCFGCCSPMPGRPTRCPR
ncbi:hypothetical protein P7K49_023116 [Saguinus oedipus]|uniref:Uncharacterized protein n=1 Tax=Saguinus oedipus TaxID=9490 RepID=A0ABQ9ULH9_SAGOE|nr:hypothetical protein P7K49_023116 [Saguinus oedipus]